MQRPARGGETKGLDMWTNKACAVRYMYKEHPGWSDKTGQAQFITTRIILFNYDSTSTFSKLSPCNQILMYYHHIKYQITKICMP